MNVVSFFPVALRSWSSAGTVIPLRAQSAWSRGSVRGTSAGKTRRVIVWPSDWARRWPCPSDPLFGRLLPPVARTTRWASSTPHAPESRNPSVVCETASTRYGCRISTPVSRLARRSASRTFRALSVVGKSLPVSSRLSSTPRSWKKATVSGTSNRRSTRLMAPGVEPAYARASTAWCVTLHRPPPATRIFAPSLRAPSRSTTRPAPARPAAMPVISPAAPAPTTATSTCSGLPEAGTTRR